MFELIPASSLPPDDPQLQEGCSKLRNVVKDLNSRMYGSKSLAGLKRTFLTNQIYQMTLSRDVDIELIHRSTVNSMDIDKSGKLLISGGKDGSFYIHNLLNFTGRNKYTYKVLTGALVKEPHCSEVSRSLETVQWFPSDSGAFLTSGMSKVVKVWDTAKLEAVHSFHFNAKIFQHHMSKASGCSPLIAVASRMHEVKLIDLRTCQHSQELHGHSGSVFCCRWSPTDPYILATGSFDCTVRLWDVRSSRACLAVLDKANRKQEKNQQSTIFKSHDGSVNGLEFAPNGRLLISLGSDNTACCWDVNSFQNLNMTYEKINNRKARGIEFSVCELNNRHICFVPDQCKIVVFEVETGKRVKNLCGHFGSINTCRFHESKMELLSGAQDRYILLWTVDSPQKDHKKQLPNMYFGCESWDRNDD